MSPFLAVGLSTLVFALALTPVAMRLATHMGWVDQPGLRKIHKQPVAYLGGAAIFGALCLGLVVLLFVAQRPSRSLQNLDLRVLSLLGGAALLLIVGLVDDLRKVRPRNKLLAQIVAALVVCASGITIRQIHITDTFAIEFGQLSYLVTVLWIVGITNAVNLIDGMDGLATGLSAVAAAAIGWVAYQTGIFTAAILMVALLGALLGFLPYNLNPAKIFMGDSGSMVLGFLLSSTGVLCAAKTATIVGVGLPLVALGIPIFDTLFAMVRRVLEGRSLFSADRNHIHHRLLALGFGQTRIVLLLCAETAAAVSFVLFIPTHSNLALTGIVALGLLSHVTLFRVFGAIRFRDSFSGLSRITAAARHAKEERMNLDDIELQFREASSVHDWWQAVCNAGTELGLARMELDMPCREGPPIRFEWSGTANPCPARDDLMQMSVPVRRRRLRSPLSIRVEAQAGDSLETAGRHIAHLCRLLDRHGIADLPPGAPQRLIRARKLQAV